MRKLMLAIAAIFITQSTPAKSLVRINTIGSSPRGQYVAFEEFGYKEGRKYPYSRIRVMNVWKNRYVDDAIQVIGKTEKEKLDQVRKKAKAMAIKKFKKFNIES